MVKNPNSWSCLLASAAMVLDQPLERLVQDLGHDGSKIMWPELTEPYRRKSFHIQEIVLLCLKYKHSCTCLETNPLSTPSEVSLPIQAISPAIICERIRIHAKKNKGICITPTHACAWDGFKIFDPKGLIYLWEDLKELQFFFLIKEF